jgi:hypothetical protein
LSPKTNVYLEIELGSRAAGDIEKIEDTIGDEMYTMYSKANQQLTESDGFDDGDM